MTDVIPRAAQDKQVNNGIYVQPTEDGNFGLDKDIADNAKKKYDIAKEQEVRTWIEKVLDEKLEDGLGALEFQKLLQSGVVLCQLANKIKKDVCKLPRSTSQPAVQRENISFYLKACEKLGMTDNFIFMTDNLFQESTGKVELAMMSVINNLLELKKIADKSSPAA